MILTISRQMSRYESKFRIGIQFNSEVLGYIVCYLEKLVIFLKMSQLLVISYWLRKTNYLGFSTLNIVFAWKCKINIGCLLKKD